MRLGMTFLPCGLSSRFCTSNEGAPACGLRALAAYWCVLSMMLVAKARRVSLATKMRDQSEAAFAQMLEAAIYTALIQLAAEIAAHDECGVVRTREDEDALAYLRTVHALLGVLALLIRQLRSDLDAVAERRARLAGLPVKIVPRAKYASPIRAENKAPP